jgi:phosphopantothenoylcysteine decarboxylase / phosphopantothenate---cysteine ligase
MHDAVHAAVAGCDLLIMAAAVADYRPATMAEQKIKKTAGASELDLHLVQTTDILASLAATSHCIKVGFAAETHDLERYARAKLERKGLDLIVANDARTALGAADNAVTIYAADGAALSIERQPKAGVARAILDVILARWPQPKSRSSSAV